MRAGPLFRFFGGCRELLLKICNLNIEKPDECILVSSLPDKALITLVDIARSRASQHSFSKPILVDLISKDASSNKQ